MIKSINLVYLIFSDKKPIFSILFRLEKLRKNRNIFIKSGFCQGELILKTRHLSNFDQKFSNKVRNHSKILFFVLNKKKKNIYFVHYFQKTSICLIGNIDEIKICRFGLRVRIGLFSQEILHFYVVIFTNQLQETEYSRQNTHTEPKKIHFLIIVRFYSTFS